MEVVLAGSLAHGSSTDRAAAPSPLDVHEVTDDGELSVFRDVYLEGFGWMPPWGRTMWDGVTRGLAGWRFFLCRCEGKPAAAGILFQAGSVAYMAAAATLKDFRGRGCRAALLSNRQRAALTAGCTCMAGGTGFANRASFRNQQRAGLALVDAIAVWTQITRR